MKRTLLATTALVAFAGVAAAEIEISGSAEMGLVGGDYRFAGDDGDGVTQFWTDVDVTFTMTGETDGGLSFGTSVDLDEAPDLDADGERSDADFAVFISGAFGTLTMGDTDGAMDWALTEAGNVGNPGTISDTETEHAGYNGAYLDGAYDGQILRYDYSFGDFGFAVSAEMDDGGDEDTGFAAGVKYAADLGGLELDLGLAYQTAETVDFGTDRFEFDTGTVDPVTGDPILGNPEFELEDVDVIGVSVATEFAGGFAAGVQFSTWSFDDIDGTDIDNAYHLGLGAGYSSGPLSLHANYGMFDADDGEVTLSGAAIVAAYDLGGGASIHAGVAQSAYDIDGGPDDDASDFSLGMAFSF
ncbi:porin [Parasulfitobacter algicola]|uniref:Porin n=1 Tax=Parasulfitobacter algicola TaxID=2614809 RepID=A0ABX2IRS8_9RHOB|nr:porin [Sulfitobacter algicola]NSX53800.1 porin [Sulfitobacter algicola]